MPDRPLTVLTYAASASLAAVAITYFFHPGFLFDSESSATNASSRKRGIIGLSNPANDCFINSVLQSLAGLGTLRIYLIRELHRRELGGATVYSVTPTDGPAGKEVDEEKLLSLQDATVTRALKDVIDRLNERPIYRKTISARPFIRELEVAFGTTISKAQQDAQELLQIVAERLSEEYHAGRLARKRAREGRIQAGLVLSTVGAAADTSEEKLANLRDGREDINVRLSENSATVGEEADGEQEEGFPLEGQTEARTECQFCHFMPKAQPTSFVMLNLMVPQKSSSSLDECFDAHFKTEMIEDYKCDKCRLIHAIEVLQDQIAMVKEDIGRTRLRSDIARLEKALAEDPESLPKDIALPPFKSAPSRKIARHIEITKFPNILVIHLSRSIFDPQSISMKNLAKVSFPEHFPVGGLLDRRTYRLLGVITHKGTHNSGHYETFRRQHCYAPYANSLTDSSTGPYGDYLSSKDPAEHQNTYNSSNISGASPEPPGSTQTKQLEKPAIEAPIHAPGSPSSLSAQSHSRCQEQTVRPKLDDKNLSSSTTTGTLLSQANNSMSMSKLELGRMRRRKKPMNRWWRISDDKIKECRLNDVLDMKKEVYMLFYELDNSLSEE